MVEITQNIDGLRSLSQLFSAANFRRILVNDDLNLTKARLARHVLINGKTTYLEVFREIYNKLLNSYRNEYFYKNALLNKVVLGQYSLNTTTILNEFRIGSSCADFVFLNGEVRIYEIKTELDDLSKLRKQIEDYSKFSNKVYIVSSSKHSRKLQNAFGETGIGIIEYTSKNTLKELSKANDLNRLDHTTIFKTLRKPEYTDLIFREFGEIPNVPNTKIFKECLEMVKLIDIEIFQSLAMKQLKRRSLQSPECLTSSETPQELKFLCHTMDLSDYEYLSLYSFLKKTV